MYRNPAPFKTSADLLKIYRAADEKARYLPDPEDKLLAYNDVIKYCSNSKFCLNDESVKRNQILYWTYNKIGDMFAERGQNESGAENDQYALQYYRNSLEFTRQPHEKIQTFEKISQIFLKMNDQEKWRQTRERIAEETEESMKRQAYTELFRTTDDLKLQAFYLEKALDFVVDENISVREKYKNTLRICRHLLQIYEQLGQQQNYDRILTLQNKTLELFD
jgi:hypothetical protein